MKQYLQALEHVLNTGEYRGDRTGTGTISTFHVAQEYDLKEGFPAMTTKKLAWRAVVGELLWMLEGSDDERRLAEITFEKPREELVGRSTIWTANADAQGVALGYTNNDDAKILGPVYGVQWRGTNNRGPDQITTIAEQIKNNPNDRRIILNAWNVKDLPYMALPPCHLMAQFYVDENNDLSCMMYQRSADMFLGVPFNIASYSLLTHILASYCGTGVGRFLHIIGDAHIYQNHVSQVQEQLNRQPNDRPTLVMPEITSLDTNAIRELKVSDFQLQGYNPAGTISAPMAV